MSIMCQVDDCNYNCAGPKWAHNLEYISLTELFQVSIYFAGKSLCPFYAIWIFFKPQKVPIRADHL